MTLSPRVVANLRRLFAAAELPLPSLDPADIPAASLLQVLVVLDVLDVDELAPTVFETVATGLRLGHACETHGRPMTPNALAAWARDRARGVRQ